MEERNLRSRRRSLDTYQSKSPETATETKGTPKDSLKSEGSISTRTRRKSQAPLSPEEKEEEPQPRTPTTPKRRALKKGKQTGELSEPAPEPQVEAIQLDKQESSAKKPRGRHASTTAADTSRKRSKKEEEKEAHQTQSDFDLLYNPGVIHNPVDLEHNQYLSRLDEHSSGKKPQRKSPKSKEHTTSDKSLFSRPWGFEPSFSSTSVNYHFGLQFEPPVYLTSSIGLEIQPGMSGRRRDTFSDDDADEDEIFASRMQRRAHNSMALNGAIRRMGNGLDISGSSHTGISISRILHGLHSEGDSSAQLQALTEMSSIMAMSPDESVMFFNPEIFIPPIVNLLTSDGNPNVMLIAARTLTTFMELIPASASIVVNYGATPVLCSKLMNVEYIDLAEQSLQAIEKISIDHPQAVLKSGGLGACLTFIDFFPISVQRTAAATAANMCRQAPSDMLHSLSEGLQMITNLLDSADSKIMESACLCYARLAESLIDSDSKLQSLAKTSIIEKFISIFSSPVTNMTTLTPMAHSYVTHFFAVCSHGSPALSIQFMKRGIVPMTHQILTNSLNASSSLLKSNESIFELLTLCYELLPVIPTPANTPFAIFQRQISKLFSRRRNRRSSNETTDIVMDKETTMRLKLLDQNPELLIQFGELILPLLLNIFEANVNSSIRLKSLAIINRAFYHAPPPTLTIFVKKVHISSFITSLLSLRDWTLIAITIQITEVLLRKLPKIFGLEFRREGVLNEVERLIQINGDGSSEDDDESSGGRGRSGAGNRSSGSRRRSGSDQESSSTGPSGSSNPKVAEIRNWALEKAKNIRETYFSEQNPETMGTAQEAEAIIGKLRHCSQILTDSTEQPNISPRIFEMMGEIFSPAFNVSSFELLASGFFDAFLKFLTYTKSESQDEAHVLFNRIRRFVSWVLEYQIGESGSKADVSSNRAPMFSLILSKIQDVINKTDSFPTQNADYSGRSFGLKYLTQPFKLKLKRAEGETVLREYSNNVVHIEPLVTVQALEDFLWGKVQVEPQVPQLATPSARVVQKKRDASPWRAGHSASPSGRRPPDHMIGLPGQASGFDDGNSSGFDEQGEGILSHEKETPERVADVRLSEGPKTPASPLTSPTSTIRKKINAHKLTLCYLMPIDDERSALFPLSSLQSSIFHCIQQVYRTSGELTAHSRDESFHPSKLWMDTHTIVYRSANESDEGATSPSKLFSNSVKLEGGIVEKDQQSWFQKSYLCTIRDAEAASQIFPDNIQMALILLSIFNLLNNHWSKIFDTATVYNFGPGSLVQAPEFHNQLLTSKMNRQLQDPLVICGGTVAEWCKVLCQQFGFLFSFNTREHFFFSTSFGVARGLQRLQQKTQEHGISEKQEFKIGRISRQKVRIARDRILQSALRVMNLYSSGKSVLEVEYFDEIGTGLGPTLEFYTLSSRELQRRDLNIWMEFGHQPDSTYVTTSKGLFPRPFAASENLEKVLPYFKCLGQLIAKALMDGRILDISIAEPFYKIILGRQLSLFDVELIDEDLYRNLNEIDKFCIQLRSIQQNKELTIPMKQKMLSSLRLYGDMVESLGLDFTFPGLPDVELKPNGSSIDVTTTSIPDYYNNILRMLFGDGIIRQVEAFESGFSSVFSLGHLKTFTSDEIDTLVNGSMDKWDMQTLLDSTKCDHGFTHDSKTVKFLLEVMVEMTPEEQREFILFITGSPKLPVGGIAALHPHLTIVRKAPPDGYEPDHVLPSVSTCFYYLKLPEYSTKEILREKLFLSMREGQGNFLLS